MRPNFRSPQRPMVKLSRCPCRFRQKIRQSLRGMLVTAVAGIDDRNGSVVSGNRGSTLLRMTDDHDIGKTGDDARRIGHGFALRCRRGLSARKAHRASAEIQHGGLMGKTGSRRRLVEAGRHFSALAGMRVFFRVQTNVVSTIKKLLELLHGKVKRCQQISFHNSYLLNIFKSYDVTIPAPAAGLPPAFRECARSRPESP